MTDARQYAPATARNRDPILTVLKDWLPADSLVLEVASGTGEHGVYFSQHLTSLFWQPTDLSQEAIASIQAWQEACPCDRLLAPFQVDVQSPGWWLSVMKNLKVSQPLKAIVTINMIHISPWSATEGLFQGAEALLPSGGVLYLYGPYNPHSAGYESQQNQERQKLCQGMISEIRFACLHLKEILRRLKQTQKSGSKILC